MVQGGPRPAECLALLREHECAVILGNSDAFVLDPDSIEEPSTAAHIAGRERTLEQLGDADLDYIRSFAPTITVESDGHTLLCFHATPRSYEEVVLPSQPPEPLGAPGADVLAGGHVHVPQLRRVGAAIYVNPGSVGLGYDLNQPQDDFWIDPWAAYAIVDLTTLAVEYRRVLYPIDDELREWARFRPSSI